MMRFDYKKNPKWMPFGFCLFATPLLFIFGKYYFGLILLLFLTTLIIKGIFFPIAHWVMLFPKFKQYTVTGVWLTSMIGFYMAYIDEAEMYVKFIFPLYVLWGAYLEYKTFKQKRKK